MNKQPFYHKVEILFTSTTGFSEEACLALLKKAFNSKTARKDLGVVQDTIEIETYLEPEPGDPADLM